MENLTIINTEKGHTHAIKGHITAQQAQALGAVSLSYQFASDASEKAVYWCIWQRAVFSDNATLLNIGLDIPASNGGGTLAQINALKELKELGIKVVAQNMHTNKTGEKVLIVAIKKPLTLKALYDLSIQFGQDTIAQRYADHRGVLVGQRARDFNEYKAEDFLLLNGEFAA